MKRVSLGIVIAALAVSAPRLTLAFLVGDGIRIPEAVEIAILTITGVASGIVLTVGNAVLAHALASKAHQRGALWWINALAWICFLVGAVVIVAPTLVAGMRQSSLAAVLVTPQAQWLWAVTAVVIVELLVGAAMAAAILTDEQQPVSPARVGTSRWTKVLDAATDRMVEGLRSEEQPRSARLAAFNPALNDQGVALNKPVKRDVQVQPVAGGIGLTEQTIGLEEGDAILAALSSTERAVLRQFQVNPHATYQQVAAQVGVTKGTISNYVKRFKPLGLVHVSKQAGVVVVPEVVIGDGV